MDHCCADDATAPRSLALVRVLWIVLIANGAMFFVEAAFAFAAGSSALQADSIDFFGDAVTYGVSLYVAQRSLRQRAGAGLAKGLMMGALGLAAIGVTVLRLVSPGVPEAITIGAVGTLALVVNLACAAALYRYRHGDSNMRSVWLCSRNDAIGNLAVIAAAVGVFGLGSALPDLAVGAALAALQLSTAASVIRQAVGELRPAGAAGAA